MIIHDNGMQIDLSSDDPRADKIRAILFSQAVARNPIDILWGVCSTAQRKVLVAIAEAKEISQADLEKTLELNAVALRGLHSGLAKIAKRERIEYPVRATGGRRESRRFSLDHTLIREILTLNQKLPNARSKP